MFDGRTVRNPRRPRGIFRHRGNRALLWALLFLFAGTIGATSYTPPNNNLSYLAFAAIMLGGVVAVSRSARNAPHQKLLPYDAVPLAFMGVWLYGFVLGLAQHNRPGDVLHNFAGMVLYSMYYVFLYRKVNRFDLLRCVLAGASVNAVYMYSFFLWDKLIHPLVSHTYRARDFARLSVRAYYSDTLILLAVAIAFSAYQAIRPRTPHVGRAITRLYAYAFAFLQITLSKATLVAYVAGLPLLFVYARTAVAASIRDRRAVRIALVAGTLAIAVYPAGRTIHYFADEGLPPDESEAVLARRLQTTSLIRDFHLFGRGLGATLGSAYSRDPTGYGFEQSYLNLIHKTGVASVVVFSGYALIALRIIMALHSRRLKYFGLGSAGFFVGLVMAYGNPILMSPVMVTYQSVVLYWFRPSTDDSRSGSGVCA